MMPKYLTSLERDSLIPPVSRCLSSLMFLLMAKVTATDLGPPWRHQLLTSFRQLLFLCLLSGSRDPFHQLGHQHTLYDSTWDERLYFWKNRYVLTHASFCLPVNSSLFQLSYWYSNLPLINTCMLYVFLRIVPVFFWIVSPVLFCIFLVKSSSNTGNVFFY